MKKVHALAILHAFCIGINVQLFAQMDWIAGGGWRSSSPAVSYSGNIGLQSLPDREWTVGVERPFRRGSRRVGIGSLATLRFRSPFYELDKPLPYYPLKAHLPTHRFESAQLFLFLSVHGELAGTGRLGWRLQTGPVLHVHAGNYLSTTTAISPSTGSSFVLYRLRVQGQPMGIPFWRIQGSGSIRIWRRSLKEAYLEPFASLDLGDRSQIRYLALPEDGANMSEGTIKNGKWLVGLLCRLSFGK
jgi:hypothetical protein